MKKIIKAQRGGILTQYDTQYLPSISKINWHKARARFFGGGNMCSTGSTLSLMYHFPPKSTSLDISG